MKKISTLLLASALVAPMSVKAEDLVTGTAKIEYWSAYTASISGDFIRPYTPDFIYPDKCLGAWTSEEGNFSYNPETGHYYIKNYLNGGEDVILEFAVGKTLRDFSAVKVFSVLDDSDDPVAQPVIDPLRYDFEVFYKNSTEGEYVYGLTPADYADNYIRPAKSMTSSNWIHFVETLSSDGSSNLGPFVGGDDTYYLKSGFRIDATSPQRSATGTVTAFIPIPVTEERPSYYGTEAPSMAQLSYVVEDGDNYVVYIGLKNTQQNVPFLNDEPMEGATKPGVGKILKMSFNKETLEAGVDAVIADNENAPVEYYNIQGVKVENPANGLYIKRQGEKVSKVMVK